MQKLLLSLLAFFARMIVQIHRPYIIWVTGTVGKTTITKYVASYLELSYPHEVRISPYHYNGEYGLPLSIIGAKTGGKNPFRWLWVFLVAITACIRKYPKYLVLEYGIDHAGEMDFLLSIATPNIAIVSPIASNHLEQFGTLINYRNEKLKILRNAEQCIIHESLRLYGEQDALYYGTGSMSEIDASHFSFSLTWVSAEVTVQAEKFPITLPSFGAYQIENILPCYAIGSILGLDLENIWKNSHLFSPESWRSSVLRGQGESVIIDGSYNWWYESICRGIDSVLPFLPSHRILFFLWDMRELWEHAENLHKDLAAYILEHIDEERDVQFFLVWPLMEKYVSPIIAQVFPVFTNPSSRILSLKIHEQLIALEKPTIIYVKGSQNTIFLEEGIKNFLKKTEDSQKLCRQSALWMKKKEEFFKTIPQEKPL